MTPPWVIPHLTPRGGSVLTAAGEDRSGTRSLRVPRENRNRNANDYKTRYPTVIHNCEYSAVAALLPASPVFVPGQGLSSRVAERN